MIASILLLLFVTVQRLGELWLARRNTARLIARGAHEVAPGHYRYIVALHTAWLLGLWWLAWDEPVRQGWLGLYALLQVFRGWVIGSLGARWTTRIIVLPGEPLVRRGPYRVLPHPNYLVVAAEIAVLPLVFGFGLYALLFSILNAVVLSVRIRAEDKALKTASPPAAGAAAHRRPGALRR